MLFKKYTNIKILFLSVSAIFLAAVAYEELPYYLQKYYDKNIIESPYPYEWYSSTNIENHKNFFTEIKNNKSVYLNNAINFDAKRFISEKSEDKIKYYNNIYDNAITNIIVTNKDTYKKIKFKDYEKPIENLIFNNFNNGYLDKQTFYIRENYNYKSWLYSNKDIRYNIINYSDAQIERISKIMSSSLKSFDENRKKEFVVDYIIAHEMSHTQDYQILSDIPLIKREVLADLSATIYLLKKYNFDKIIGNEIIDSIEIFRSANLNKKTTASVYLPFEGLESLRILLNAKNTELFSIRNENINFLAMKIEKNNFIVGAKTVKKLLSDNRSQLGFNQNDIEAILKKYIVIKQNLKKSDRNLTVGEKKLVSSAVQTYKTNASRADIIAQIKLYPVLEQSFNTNLIAKNFRQENVALFLIIDAIGKQDDFNYRKNMVNGDVSILSSKIDKVLTNGVKINLSNYIRLAGILNYEYTLKYISDLKSNKSIHPSKTQ